MGRQILLSHDEGFCSISFPNLGEFHKAKKGTTSLARKMKNAQIVKLFAAVDRVMRGYLLPRVAFNGLLFCGEAAGNHYGLHCMISGDKAAQIAAPAALENDATRDRLAEYESWVVTSDIGKKIGRPPPVLKEEFDLEQHCRDVAAQKSEMSDIDI